MVEVERADVVVLVGREVVERAVKNQGQTQNFAKEQFLEFEGWVEGVQSLKNAVVKRLYNGVTQRVMLPEDVQYSGLNAWVVALCALDFEEQFHTAVDGLKHLLKGRNSLLGSLAIGVGQPCCLDLVKGKVVYRSRGVGCAVEGWVVAYDHLAVGCDVDIYLYRCCPCGHTALDALNGVLQPQACASAVACDDFTLAI